MELVELFGHTSCNTTELAVHKTAAAGSCTHARVYEALFMNWYTTHGTLLTAWVYKDHVNPRFLSLICWEFLWIENLEEL